MDLISDVSQLYPTLGDQSFDPTKKLTAAQPDWIRNAIPISANLKASQELLSDVMPDLDKNIIKILREQGVLCLFPVQMAIIPELLNDIVSPPPLPPHDICVSAPTGSGKTLCYVLPIIQALKERVIPRIRALVVLPVQDLALQVFSVFDTFAKGSCLKVMLLSSQKDVVSEMEEIMKLAPDILVATPGRLIDHIFMSPEHANYFNLSRLRYLVIDEADRLMVDYRIDWMSAVVSAVYHPFSESSASAPGNQQSKFIGGSEFKGFDHRQKITQLSLRNLQNSGLHLQKILLSATLSYDPVVLQQWGLFQPKLFSVQGENTAATTYGDTGVLVFPPDLSQQYVICKSKWKPLLVYVLTEQNKADWRKILCFVKSKDASHRLNKLLVELGMSENSVQEFGAQCPIWKRKRLMKRFLAGKIRILLCSDLAARGVDIADVDCVLNYSPAKLSRTYAHRVGRTARAGAKGLALSLLTESELEHFRTIMTEAGNWGKLQNLALSSDVFEEHKVKYNAALQNLQRQLEEEKQQQRGFGRKRKFLKTKVKQNKGRNKP